MTPRSLSMNANSPHLSCHARLALVVALVCLPLAAHAKRSLPDWLEQAMERVDAYPSIDHHADALILHASLHAGYRGGGKVQYQHRRAVHIRTRDERRRAVAIIPSLDKARSVRGFSAWMIYPSGKIEQFNKRDLIKQADDMESLFSETSAFILDRSYSVRAGTVFAYEYEISDDTVFLQDSWDFQDTIPTAYSSVEIEVPNDWSVKGQLLGIEDVSFNQDGNRHRWIAVNLEALPEEDRGPPNGFLAGRLAITVEPDERERRRSPSLVFSTWNDVASYSYQAQSKRVETSGELARKARELTAGLEDDWSRIAAICAYVQSVNYASINMNLNSGGGYVPHPASEVFRRHYGDCKDMTVLARSMLQSVGINSYPVLAAVGENEYVHTQWPSPHQFNHCIVGIEVADQIQAPAIVEQEPVGRILIFDPTQRFTPVGELPDSLQGTKALISSDKVSGLANLPRLGSQLDRAHRQVKLALDERGNLVGEISETVRGSIAVHLRALRRTTNEEEFQRYVQSWIASGTRDALIRSVELIDDFDRNEVQLAVAFSSPLYGRRVGAEKFIFKPVFLGRHKWVAPEKEKRRAAFVQEGWSLTESIEYEIPKNFAFAEAPQAYQSETSFATYELNVRHQEGKILVSRQLESRHEIIAPDRYPEVVEFYENASRADSSPVILDIQ